MAKAVMIRNGRVKDKHQVLAIWKELMEYHIKISAIDYEMVDDAPDIFMRFYENNVRSRNKTAIIAEEDGVVIGYLLGVIQKRPPVFKTAYQAYISDMSVTKSKRNIGIGSKIVEAFVAWAKEKEIKYIVLTVIPENEIGRAFWKKHGFGTIMLNQRKML